jgi:hypothetical protein
MAIPYKRLWDMIGIPFTKQERSLSGMDKKIKDAIKLQKDLGYTGRDVDAYIGSGTTKRAKQAGPEMVDRLRGITGGDTKGFYKKLANDVQYTRKGDSFSSLPQNPALDPLMQGVMDVESFGGNPTALQGAGNILSNALSPLQYLPIMQASRVAKAAGATPFSSGALGQFQLLPDEIMQLAVQAGLDPETDTFSEENQRKMAEFLIMEKKRPTQSMGNLLKDQNVPIEEAQRAGAGIWAGLPNVGGKSRYTGTQGNTANMSEAEYKRLLQQTRQGLLAQ